MARGLVNRRSLNVAAGKTISAVVTGFNKGDKLFDVPQSAQSLLNLFF